MKSVIFFVVAAFFEIAGCFGFWMWLRNGRSAVFALAGVASLIAFAWALTRIDAAFAGRAFAAYGGIYVMSSLVWLRLVEGVRPDRWDLVGGSISVVGALVIILRAAISDLSPRTGRAQLQLRGS
jgi:small multidrug resistance family-3 protein